jgi:putative transposase
MPKKLKLRLPRAAYQALYARWETPGLDKRVRDRLSMVLDAAKEHDTARIAADHAVDVQTVRKYLKAYQAGGVAALSDRPRTGRPPALSAADWAALTARLDAGATGERTWTLRQLVDWLATERGVTISAARLGRHLHQRRFRWKRTKRSLQHKAAADRQADKAADLGTLQAFAQEGALDLVYVDAVGFAPTFPVSYTWAREGVRPLLRYEAPRNRRVNVFGAYAPCGPQARFAYLTSTEKLTSAVFLDFLWRQVGGMTTPLGVVPRGFVRKRPCVIVLANGSVHTSLLVKAYRAALAAADIHLFYLPTYSPKLNRIEALWRQIKHSEIPVRSYTELTTLLAAVIVALEQHASDPSFTPKNLRKCA